MKDNQTLFEFEKHLTETPFQIIDSPLFYTAYFKTATETVLYVKQHHLISDAWSTVLSTNKIIDYYLRLKNNEDVSNIQEPSFIEYLETEKEYLESKRFFINKTFWQEKFQTIPEFVYLKKRPRQHSSHGKRMSFIIPNEISLKINQFCKENNISVFVLFTAIFSIYVNKTTSKNVIALGTTVLNRSNFKEKNTLGMFINVIPIVLLLDNSMSLNSYLAYVLSEWKNILHNSHYPYDLIMEEYRQKHKTSDDLFDVTITYQNAVHTHMEGFGEVKSCWHPYGHQTNSLNINISNRENSNCYTIDFDYLSKSFTDIEIKRLYNHLFNILNDALTHPTKLIGSLNLLSESEKYQLMHEFNNTLEVLNRDHTLHQSFEEQAIQNPNNIAVIYESQKLTYNELNEKANQIAWKLRKKGIKPNSIIGIFVKRSLEMLIGILGILKAGGAYLPIDSACPKDRIEYILQDSNCTILLTNIPLMMCNTEWDGEIINFNVISSTKNTNNLANINHSHDLAYVIYTSGSTGKPKGVMIEHHSIINTIKWRIKHYDFNSRDVLLQIPPYNFDSSVEDIFSFLSVGATIILINQDKRLDLIYLKKLITEYKVTHFLVTPLLYQTMLDEIADDLKFLTSVTVAGENFHISLVKKHFRKLPQVKLYNEYGPTENSVCSTVYQFSPKDEEVLIGKPITNTHCYVLNQDFQLQPVETSGELYVGGSGLARGYLNNPELTNEKFISIPNINERLYKTGDLVQWTPEGNLKFIERIDNQVKIRGYRIELSEIEFQLLKHESIKEAVVLVREDKSGNRYLCAYVVLIQNIPAAKLKEFLAKNLPDYMIPAYFVILDRIPLSPNGKIDKQALPELSSGLETAYLAPQNEIEEKMVKAWSEVLGIERIGINDDFFELGGDSLAIIRVFVLTYDYNWDLEIQDLYKYRCIKKLAEYILSRKEEQQIKNNQISFVVKSLDSFRSHIDNNIDFSKKRPIKNILLTGATGFLGIHILYELLQLNEVKVYSLVRGMNKDEAGLRLFKLIKFYFPHLEYELLNQKITVVNGDITKPQFNLSEFNYNKLNSTIDTVIHTAALVKHYGEYKEFEKINVFGVRNILEFSRDKYLVHISTTSISGDYAEQRFKDLCFDENSLDIGQNFHGNCYVQTKFEAETVISQHIKNGLHGTIIRVGNLTGRYSDGFFQINISENKFYRILKSIIELSMIPKSLTKATLEFTPVDLCSKAIVKILQILETDGKTFHLFNQNYIEAEDLCKMLNSLGYRIEIVKDLLFYNYIKNLVSQNRNCFETLSGIITDFRNGKLNYNSSVIVDSRYSVATLKQLDFSWPQIDNSYLKKIIGYMQSIEFIKERLNNNEETFYRLEKKSKHLSNL